MWTDEHFLQCQWAWACGAVEWACGTRFGEAPVLRACSSREYDRARVAGRLPARPATTTEALDEAGSPKRSPRTWFEIGFCDENTGRVFVHPAGLQDCTDTHPDKLAPSVNVLRLILVHEATHALDFQRYPELFRGGSRHSLLLEGHAWQVTEAVTRAYGWGEDYKDMVRLVLRVSCDIGEGDSTADAIWQAAEEPRESYDLGRSLFLAAEGHGGRPVIEDLLKNVPRRAMRTGDDWDAWLRTRIRRARE